MRPEYRSKPVLASVLALFLDNDFIPISDFAQHPLLGKTVVPSRPLARFYDGVYDGRMTYFEDPAYADYAAEERDAEELADLGWPHLDPEDRPEVAEGDVETVSAQDLADLARVLDWEEHSLTL